MTPQPIKNVLRIDKLEWIANAHNLMMGLITLNRGLVKLYPHYRDELDTAYAANIPNPTISGPCEITNGQHQAIANVLQVTLKMLAERFDDVELV